MEGMTEEKFDPDLLRTDLCRETAEAGFVFVRRCSECELVAEGAGDSVSQCGGDGVGDGVVLSGCQCIVKNFFGWLVHADKETATAVVGPRPSVDCFVDGSPTSEIEVADAEVGSGGNVQRLPEGVNEVEFDIVEDARH